MNQLKHVAIIMDGNGRWGLKKKKSRNYGHQAGLETVEKIIKSSIKNEIKYLTLFAFSTENWKRPKNEIKFLFKLLNSFIDKKLGEFIKNNIRLKIVGDTNKLNIKLKKKLNSSEKITQKNNKLQVNLALNYGSRDEIVCAFKKLIKNGLKTNTQNLEKNLYTYGIPDPDILIRTGGYKRLSNYLMYNLCYTELFFTDTLWPEFNSNELEKIINEFEKINRNYGL